MAEQKDRTFADGFIFKRNEKAPEFVIGRLSAKVDEAIAFLKSNAKNGWVNMDIKTGRTGNYYIELDTFEPKAKEEVSSKTQTKAPAKQEEPEYDEDLPF